MLTQIVVEQQMYKEGSLAQRYYFLTLGSRPKMDYCHCHLLSETAQHSTSMKALLKKQGCKYGRHIYSFNFDLGLIKQHFHRLL